MEKSKTVEERGSMTENTDNLLRNYFAGNSKNNENQLFPDSPQSCKEPFEPNLVTLGLEFSRLSDSDSDHDDFVDTAKTIDISLGEISFSSDPANFQENAKKSPQLPSPSKPRMSPGSPSHQIESGSNSSPFRRVVMFFCLVLTFGIISPAPLSYLQDDSATQKEKVEAQLLKRPDNS